MMETRWEGAQLSGYPGGLPAGMWRRVLALWGFTPVPFFAAFNDEVGEYVGYRETGSLQKGTNVGRGSSACSGRGRAFCRTPHR